MVKFQKQLEGQLVAEWRNAYVNYKQLKKDIRQIRQQITTKEHNPVTNTTAFNKHSPSSSLIIHHHKTKNNSGGGEEMVYETELICGQVPWTEHDRVFFSRLDSQLNMVNKFYRAKEKEYRVRGKQLQLQLETLIDKKRARATSKIHEHPSDQEIDIEYGENDGAYRGKGSKNNDAFGVSKHKVGHAEKMLRTAFIEYYKGLTLLQNYSSLNTLAFAKILKKYDKVTGKTVMETYLREVQSSYLSTGSEKVQSMVEKVENLFTKYFSKNNRRQAMSSLRPSPHQSSNYKIFSLGLFAGCSWGLLLTLVLVVSQPHIASYVIRESFIMNVVPIFSTAILLPFHIYMYGLNVYFWTRSRINYAFIFEFTPGTELRSLEVMIISAGLLTIAISSIVAHLLLFPIGKIIPITILLVILVFVFLPFDICYRSARFYFIQCSWRIICAPFYKVEFADFFLADQFTSQITTLRSLGYISCYYASHLLCHNSDSSACSGPSIQFQHIVAVLPYWWRFMQCVRRWVDEKDLTQIANGGKYLSALIALLIRLKYDSSRTKLFLAPFLISSSIATVYQFYWDVVMDWGLLQRKSVNPWLRDQLILKNQSIYFISMVVNAVLRLAWLYSIIHIVMPFGPIYQNYIDFILGMAEIARRGLWNFFRLENEHLNNVGKFRAVKTVPLPFKGVDQDT